MHYPQEDSQPLPAADAERVQIGIRLREARAYVGLSQEEAATKVDVPRTALVNIEAGRRRIDAVELRRFAELYQRPVAYFTGEVATAASAAEPEFVARLANQAKKLSEGDRQELSRFAEFLASRSVRPTGGDAEAD